MEPTFLVQYKQRWAAVGVTGLEQPDALDIDRGPIVLEQAELDAFVRIMAFGQANLAVTL